MGCMASYRAAAVSTIAQHAFSHTAGGNQLQCLPVLVEGLQTQGMSLQVGRVQTIDKDAKPMHGPRGVVREVLATTMAVPSAR